jgi:hypothetical protein
MRSATGAGSWVGPIVPAASTVKLPGFQRAEGPVLGRETGLTMQDPQIGVLLALLHGDGR